MPICETCRHWRQHEVLRATRHKRGECVSSDARVPSGPTYEHLVTFADFGCVAHEAVFLPPIAVPVVEHKIQ